MDTGSEAKMQIARGNRNFQEVLIFSSVYAYLKLNFGRLRLPLGDLVILGR